MDDQAGLEIALEQARIGAAAGGVPVRLPLPCTANLAYELIHHIKIGAAIITRDGRVIGKGHNQRVQKGSATLHVCPVCVQVVPVRVWLCGCPAAAAICI